MLARHRLLTSLCALAPLACNGDRGVVGSLPDTDGTADAGTTPDTTASGTADESTGGCTEACDLEFAITHLGVVNIASQEIQLLATADGTCEGERCPSEFAVATPVACAETEAAIASPLGPEEYCRVSPMIVAFGIDVGFSTPVERSSFELLRPAPQGADDEAYWWWTGVVSLEGPGTAYRGFVDHASVGNPNVAGPVQNLTCMKRLEQEGIAWTPATLDALCDATWDDAGTLRPRRMAVDAVFSPVAGRHLPDGLSCESGGADLDDCCNSCDHALGVGVAAYGVTSGGERRDPAQGTAITCDPEADVYTQCREFVPAVDRAPGQDVYSYAWDGGVQAWPIPKLDKIRETHPDDRPVGIEANGASCDGDSECEDGWRCIGVDDGGHACSAGAACADAVCRAPWFADCRATLDTTGSTGYCIDVRFDARAAGACYVASVDFDHGSAGDRLIQCDVAQDGMEASECCDPALGGAAPCDPLTQPGVSPIPRSDRDPNLSSPWLCACDDESAASPECAEAVRSGCAPPLGEAMAPLPASPPGSYALQPLAVRGGLRWDEELGVLDLRLADLGGLIRAVAESCAEGRGLVDRASWSDGFNPSDFLPEFFADHDVAMCSGSTYRLVFTEAAAPQHVRSAAGGTLDGRAVHVFETPQFRIIPDSLFPSDNLTISACDELSLRFSNKYDRSPANLRKLEIHDDAGALVAGGLACDELATPEEIVAGAIPCLSVGVADEMTGGLSVSIDADIHGPVLQVGTRYELVVPGLPDIASMSDAAAYAAAFHDACGMPLVLGETEAVLALSEASFVIDEPCD
jgi:hypothetical protein